MKEEIWKDIPGFDGIYQASTLGRVRSVDRKVTINSPNRGGCFTRSRKGKILEIAKEGNGFNYVYLYEDGVKVKRQIQRLVAITFLENPNDCDYVGFKDGNRDNVTLENLEWTNKKCHDVTVLSCGSCSNCGEKLRNFGNVNYCWSCGKKIRWG